MTRVLWLDSTLARNPRQMREIAVRARAAADDYELRVHPQIHLEQARSMAVFCLERGRSFDPETFRGFLTQLQIPVPHFEFDESTAVEWGQRLGMRYPSSEAWNDAKRRTLGIEGTKRVPMTCDWLVALTAETDEHAVVITDDKGAEWEQLRREDRCWSYARAKRELS